MEDEAEALYYSAFAGTRSNVIPWHELTEEQKQPFLLEVKEDIQ